MASTKTIASLLIEMGMDTRQAEKSAKRMEAQLGKVADEADKVSGELDDAAASADKFGTAMQGVARATDLIGSLMLGVGAAVVGVGTAVLKTGDTFERLRVQLKTATGSVEAADEAFTLIRDFTKETPFQLEEVTDSFVKLANRGLEPTKRSLTAFGDIASSQGKSLDQFTEAVLDATTREFERLKDFGIVARQNGEEVALTFKGITTTMSNDADTIEKFLIELGENNFGGAMADQMLTLGGTMSNLMDQFTEFFNSVANMGPLEEFKGLISDIAGVAGDKEGGLAKTIARTLTKAIKGLRRLLAGDFVKTLETAAKAVELLVSNFDKLIALFLAGKTATAFSAMATGFTQMGLAAGASLGPIGAVAAALIALIPIALDVGNAIGDALATGTGAGRSRRRAPLTQAQIDKLPPGMRAELRTARESSEELRLLAEKQGGKGAELSSEAARLQESRNRAVRAKALALSDQIEAKEKREGQTAQEREAADAARLDRETRGAQLSAAFGGAPLSPQDVLDAGGGVEEATEAALQEEAFAAGQAALDKGASVEDALLAASEVGAARATGKTKKKGGGKKKKAKKRPTSIKTVSDLFRAASTGELGPIADQTPAIAEIEPTVAVDITNNNFSFTDTFNITGKGDPKEIGEQVVFVVKREFDRRNSRAGQQMAGNVVG